MTGGTLIVSRANNLHSHYKEQLEEIGFKNLIFTDVDKNGLDMIIYETAPSHVMIEACFYWRSTPYMMIEMLNTFPQLNITAVNMYDYPDSHAKWFILNGAKSYVNRFEGIKEFYRGLEYVRDGSKYVSPNVERILCEMKEMPEKLSGIKRREYEKQV